MTPLDTPVQEATPTPNWVVNANLLFDHRRLLLRAGVVAMLLGILLAFVLPKKYESEARLMPPENTNGSSAMIAALLGRAGGGAGGLGSLAGSLLGGHSSGVLFVDLLHSRVIADHIIDRFHLQELWHKKYRVDTVKRLGKQTAVVEDKKSGTISIVFTDTDPVRARDITQAYVEELNSLVMTANTSSARRERIFIEQRLVTVQAELQTAQKALSEFSSDNTTLDIKEQTHAMVDAAAKLQAEKTVGESELDSLEQIYGPDNVRVRAARARIGVLQQELNKINGSSAPQPLAEGSGTEKEETPYPSIRQLPRLAVPYANLYRTVKIQETVFELLSQQYELARIEEAKDTPVVSVIDAPLIAEKHTFPPRHLVVLIITGIGLLGACAFILLRNRWHQLDASDGRKLFAARVAGTFGARMTQMRGAR